MRGLRKLRDVEKLLEMHGDKKGYKVRVKALKGINTARTIQRMLRRQVQEMSWRVGGLKHLAAAVRVHRMIGASASLVDEVIGHLELRAFLGDDDSARRYEVLPDESSTSTHQGRTERQRAALFPFDGSASSLVSAAGRGRAKLPSSDAASTLLGATGRGRATVLDNSAPRHYRDRVALPEDPSASRRVGNDNRGIVEPTLEAATGGRGQLPLAPAAVEFHFHADHDMDFATHRLFVSGTALRQHQLGSPSIQLLVQALGRRIEEVADAVLDARSPQAVLLKELQQVKEFLHKVWKLRIPAPDFKLL